MKINDLLMKLESKFGSTSDVAQKVMTDIVAGGCPHCGGACYWDSWCPGCSGTCVGPTGTGFD